MAHLKPILESRFEVVAVVFATPQRWAIFRQALSGKTYFNLKHRNLWSTLKLIPRVLRSRMEKKKEAAAVKQMIQQHNVPLWYEFDVNSPEFLEKAQKLTPDLVISAAYPQIFKKGLLDVGRLHAVNFHPSLLPRFRGAHPHFWTIVEGETESGVSAHIMTEEIDDGDLVAQRAFDITGITYAALYDRIVAETPALVKDVEAFFLDKKGALTPQDPARISLYRNNRAIHSRVFWDGQPAVRIANLVRTGTAYFFFRNEKVLLRKGFARKKNRNMTNDIEVPAGAIVDVRDNGLVVQTQAGFMHIEEVEQRGKTMDFATWVKKYRIHVGEMLE